MLLGKGQQHSLGYATTCDSGAKGIFQINHFLAVFYPFGNGFEEVLQNRLQK